MFFGQLTDQGKLAAGLLYIFVLKLMADPRGFRQLQGKPVIALDFLVKVKQRSTADKFFPGAWHFQSGESLV